MSGLGNENLTILCKTAQLPGKTLGTAEHMRHRHIPDGTVDYGNELELVYRCDANFMDRMIIEAWQRFVHTADVSTRTVLDEGMSHTRFKKRWNTIYDLQDQRMFSSIVRSNRP